MKFEKDNTKLKDKVKKFFEKIYYSLFKIEKYPEMISEGLKKACVYIRNIIFILGALYATILAIYGMNNMKKIVNYLKTELPEIVYEEGILKQENEARIVLDDDLIKNNLGEIIIVDTLLDMQSLKEEFKNYEQPAIIFASEKCLQVDEMGKITEFEYDSVFKNLTENGYTRIGKNEIVYLIGNVNFPTYFIRFALSYLIVSCLYVFGYCFLTTVMFYFYFKRDKIFSFSEIYTTCLYASTALSFGFILVSLNLFNLGSIFEISFLIIAFIYAIKGLNNLKKYKRSKN